MKKFFISLVILFSIHSLYAQSATVVTEILNSEKATFGQLCYIVAVHEGLVRDSASYTDAINILFQEGQIPSFAYEDAYVPYANLAYLYAKIFKVKGGLMFRIFHGAPRYAFKQLKYDGIISENALPDSLVSGQKLLDIYTACMIKYSDFKLSAE